MTVFKNLTKRKIDYYKWVDLFLYIF